MLLRLLRSSNGVDMWSVIMYILSTLLTIFLILPIHECAHALVAGKLGDKTPKRLGRVTLNPLAHIDYVGASMMLIIGFGWAKPVPVDPWKFKNPKRGMALTALAGPVSNLIAALIGGLVINGIFAANQMAIANGDFQAKLDMILAYNDMKSTGWNYSIVCMLLLEESNKILYYVALFFEYFTIINIGLAIFNFIPIPPLDGSRILMAFLPDNACRWLTERQQILSMVLMIVIIAGGLNGILGLATESLYGGIFRLTGFAYFWT